MELPKPPDDPEMTNIIDKLANFVARNGPEFEQMTKQKQRDNPKFAFLFGGENFNYYQYKVTTEQAILKKQQLIEQQLLEQQLLAQQQQALVQQEQEKATIALQQQIAALQQQISSMQAQMTEQITQSENNLAAQYQSMMRQQQVEIEEAILRVRQEKLKTLAEKCEVDLTVFDETVQPIIDSCTKDAIMNGKTWIMARASSEEHCEMISHYFLDRILGRKIEELTSKEASFSLRLHLIYLMYDIIHHCVRRNVEGLKESLEKVVVPIFCTARMGAEDGAQTEKLDKLLKLWENHGYLNKQTLEKLHDPAQALSAYQASLITDNADIVTQVSTSIQSQYNALQKQHQDFCSHLNMQLTTLQQQLAILLAQEQQVTGKTSITSDGPVTTQVVMPTLAAIGSTSGEPPHCGSPGLGIMTTSGVAAPGVVSLPAGLPYSQPPPTFDPHIPPPGLPPQGMTSLPPPQQFEYSHGLGAPTVMPAAEFALPDLSKPPPGFPPPNPALAPPPAGLPSILPTDMDLTPSVPYYNLPAGLMAPLVKLDEVDYKPLEPKDIRLPPPMAPSERLLAAVDAFYTPPSRERPRDSEGWEKLGLYEFFKAKHRAKKNKDEGRRRYSRSRSRSRSQSTSRSRSRSRSRSTTPPRRRRFDAEAEDRYRNRSRSTSRSRSRSHSQSQSRSPSPSRRRTRSRSKTRSSSRSRSRSPPPRHRSRSPTPEMPQHKRVSKERSPTPPGFNPGLGMLPMMLPVEQRLGETNKGHQLLMKMGWSGKGLGASEQGIVDPIEAADVRDKADMRKGIGIDLKDPFEQFRKSKAQGFIQRMRARDEGAPPEPPAPERKKSKKDREPST